MVTHHGGAKAGSLITVPPSQGLVVIAIWLFFHLSCQQASLQRNASLFTTKGIFWMSPP